MQTQIGFTQDRAMDFFQSLSLDRCVLWQMRYEELLAEQSPDYVPRINVRTGKPMKPERMPHMVPLWREGLGIVNQVINQKKEDKS